MKARDDIDLARTWVISDTHFGHKNIIPYCHRPENFEDVLLEQINEFVQPGDTLLHLGDLCYKGNAWFKNMVAPKIAPQAGRKLIILGNHDHQRYAFYKQTGWSICSPFYLPVMGFQGHISLAKFAFRQWIVSFSHYQWSADSRDGKLPGEDTTMHPYHHRIHGHIHNNGYYDGRNTAGGPDWRLVPYLAQHTNLSCEMTKYKPVNLQLLLDAVLLGKMPGGGGTSDGESPSASDLGKESHHA